MSKKKIFVIIIATILAFFTGLYLVNLSVKSEKNNIQEKVIEQREEAVNVNLEADLETNAPELDKIDEAEAKKDIEKIRKSLEADKKVQSTNFSVNKQVLVEEKKEENMVENSETTNSQIKDAGIIKELDTNTVVITREFKVQSPNKYSFK